MHITRTLAVAAAATMAAIVPVMPAGADSPDHAQNVATYHGTWSGGTAGMHALENQTPCTEIDGEDVSGVWNMTLKKDGSANVSMSLFVNGTFYNAWGGNVWSDRFTWEGTADSVVASLDGGYAPVPLTIVLSGDTATFTFEGLYECGDGFLVGTVR